MRAREVTAERKRQAREARDARETRRRALWAIVEAANAASAHAKLQWAQIQSCPPDMPIDQYWVEFQRRVNALGPAHDAARRALEDYMVAKAGLLVAIRVNDPT